jgi:hypothetical protein
MNNSQLSRGGNRREDFINERFRFKTLLFSSYEHREQ